MNVIAPDLKLSRSTVSTILKDKERILDAVKGSSPMQLTVITKQRNGDIHEMENCCIFGWKIKSKNTFESFT